MSKLTITLTASEKAFLHLFDKVPTLGKWSVLTRVEPNFLKVMLSLDEDDFACARSQAEEGGYLGLEDYINDELLTALMEIEDEIGEGPPPPAPLAASLPAERG